MSILQNLILCFFTGISNREWKIFLLILTVNKASKIKCEFFRSTSTCLSHQLVNWRQGNRGRSVFKHNIFIRHYCSYDYKSLIHGNLQLYNRCEATLRDNFLLCTSVYLFVLTISARTLFHFSRMKMKRNKIKDPLESILQMSKVYF